jgi:vacuolar-type H+-ATPase subunit E/Vma4
MTLRGNVQDFPLRSVLELLGQTKKTGELQVRAGGRVGALGIAAGRVVTAVLDEEEPLLALGSIFAFDGAEFEFTPWDDAPPANLEAKDLDQLLRDADEAKQRAEEARRQAEEEREAARKKAEEEREAERKRLEEIRALIPSDDTPLRLSERAVDQGAVTLTSERWRLVLAVNGERDVNAIASMLHIEPAAALASLAALVRDGVVEPIARSTAPAYEAPAYEAPAPAYEAPADEPPVYEAPAPAYEGPAETSSFSPTAATFESTPQPDAEVETPAPVQDWITPEQAVPTQDWTTSPADAAPISEVAPQWAPAPDAAPVPDWITPQAEPGTPEGDDRLSALSGIFGPAPAETQTPPPAETPTSSWAPSSGSDHWGTPPEPTPSAERWTAPPKAEPAPPASDDPWGSPPPSSPARGAWAAPAPAPAAANPAIDDWVAPTPPAPPPTTWSAPAGATGADDPWGSPRADPRTAALSIPEHGTPPVEEWSPPPTAQPEKKKRGLFGFGRDKPLPAPVAGMPLPTASAHGSRVGIVAALANALIAEYNNGQYGKGRIEERIANLLMRVDEQADPIDRPLPIVDDRIDVEALEREQLAESQALPYLALLVTTIFADAEKQFGKDRAKKGYKAAQKSVLLGDASVLSSPELAGKLPRV